MVALEDRRGERADAGLDVARFGESVLADPAELRGERRLPLECRRSPGTSVSGRKAQNTRPWLDLNGVSRAPVWMLMRTSRSGLSSARTTIGASPSHTLSTTVSFTLRTSASMCGPAIVTTGSPAPAAAARVSTCGPSVYSLVAGSKRSRFA